MKFIRQLVNADVNVHNDNDDYKDKSDDCHLTIQRQDSESAERRQKPKRNLLPMSVRTNEK